MNQKIRIKLKSFDHNLVDKSAEKIVKTVKSTGAVVSGPVPLPTHKQIFTVNRSTFVNKKAREQFQLCTFKLTKKATMKMINQWLPFIQRLLSLFLPAMPASHGKVLPSLRSYRNVPAGSGWSFAGKPAAALHRYIA